MYYNFKLESLNFKYGSLSPTSSSSNGRCPPKKRSKPTRNASTRYRWTNLHFISRPSEDAKACPFWHSFRSHGTYGRWNSRWLHNHCCRCFLNATEGNNHFGRISWSRLPTAIHGHDETGWTWSDVRRMVPFPSWFRTLALWHWCGNPKVLRDAKPTCCCSRRWSCLISEG